MTRDVPTDLELELGVGTSRIDLSEVDVRDLHVISGVGEATVDLTGPRKEDVNVDIDAGVGRLMVKLPRDVGVRVEGGESGLGNVTADGLTKQGDAYVNEAWGKPGPRMTVRVTRGIGELELAGAAVTSYVPDCAFCRIAAGEEPAPSSSTRTPTSWRSSTAGRSSPGTPW